MVKFKDWPRWHRKLPENSQPFISHSCWPQCLPALHVFPDCSLAVQAMPCISSIRAVDTKLNIVHNFSFTLLLSACVEFLAWKRNRKRPVRWGQYPSTVSRVLTALLHGQGKPKPSASLLVLTHYSLTHSETSYSPWHWWGAWDSDTWEKNWLQNLSLCLGSQLY